MINYAVATAIVQHTDSISKNFYLSQDPTTGRWSIIPWDLDHTFGQHVLRGEQHFVTPAEPGDQTSELMARDPGRAGVEADVLPPAAHRRQPGARHRVGWRRSTTRRSARLRRSPRWTSRSGRDQAAALTFAGQRTQLFNAIQARRNAFANDAGCRRNQSAAPNIVINEIQPSLARRHRRPVRRAVQPVDHRGDRPVRLDDHRAAITLTIQPGTVILPRGHDDVRRQRPRLPGHLRRLVFVGGVFTGDLGATRDR